MNTKYLSVTPEIQAALAEGRPVVALESTILSHGMPYPENLEFSHKVEEIIRAEGAIPATTAMETLHPRGRLLALESGANVVMPNVTEGEARILYELYPGKICTGDTPEKCRSCIQAKIESIGRTVRMSYGFHGEYLKNKRRIK